MRIIHCTQKLLKELGFPYDLPAFAGGVTMLVQSSREVASDSNIVFAC